jgi:hypothetical protein
VKVKVDFFHGLKLRQQKNRQVRFYRWGSHTKNNGTSSTKLIQKKMIESIPYLRSFKNIFEQRKNTPEFRKILGK